MVKSSLFIEKLSVTVENKTVLRQVSLVANPGTTHAIMGPNGSGKSTLALTLAGYPGYGITEGKVDFNGQDILKLSVHERARAGLFLGFQQPPAIPGLQVQVFLQAIMRGLGHDVRSVQKFQKSMQHAFDLVGLPAYFATRNVNEGFSGGERKRFELAQAILTQPQLLILDEIDSGLDIDALRNIQAALNYLRDKSPHMITLCITHYTRVLDAVGCDHVHVLCAGMLQQSGTVKLAQTIEQKGYQQWQ